MVANYEQLSSPRILKGSRAAIWLSCYQDSEPVAPASVGTVTVVDQWGVTVSTGAGAIDTASKRLQYVLEASETADSAKLTASWANVVIGAADPITLESSHEIIADHLFTLAQARLHDEKALDDKVKYPNAVILEARDAIHDAFEDILGIPLGGRVQWETHSGDGTNEAWLGKMRVTRLISASIRTYGGQTWTALTSAELLDVFTQANGKCVREAQGKWTNGLMNIRFTYEAGDIPGELRTAALMVLREELVHSALSARATSESNAYGTFQLSTPGKAGAYFGIPKVDETLTRLKRRMPGMA